jgi:hypothetical protein
MVLNNKSKYYLLVSMIPLITFLCWKLAFSSTINIYSDLRREKLNTQQLRNPDVKINQLLSQLNDLEKNNITDPEQLDDKLIELLSKQLVINSALLESISEIHIFNTDNYTVKTFKITFSGKYSNLLHLLDFIEQELTYFQPVSANFHKEELKGGMEKLFLDLYLQTSINKK